MHLIVGLGNPGDKYEKTRHNVGFMLLDYLARERGVTFRESKWKALTVKTSMAGEPVILVKPETFMNRSGAAVAAVMNFYKVIPENVIVIHDDLDMGLGRIKAVSGGGDGGHKGIRSIIEQAGTRDFPRIKIGIGRPDTPSPPDRYVLAGFGPEELEVISQRMAPVSEGIDLWIREGISAAMNGINQK